jgi:predicted dehydrogenase
MNIRAIDTGPQWKGLCQRSVFSNKSTRPLRVAIIGAGLMGYWHGRVARHLGLRVVAVVDPDEKRAKSVASACGATAVARELSELDSGIVDAVHVCSPTSTHGAVAVQALEAGVHAFVEKPLAQSANETQRLFSIAQRNKVILCPVHQAAFQIGVEHAKALIERNDPCAIDFRICSAGGAGQGDSELDDIVADILPHPFSMLRRLWPRVPWEPNRWFVIRPRAGELLVAGEHAGALLSVLVSMHARPTCFEMTVRNPRGAFALDLFHGFGIRHNGNVSRLRKIVRPFATSLKLFGAASRNLIGRALRVEVAYPGLQQLTRDFYSAVLGLAPTPISPEDALAVATARDAVLANRIVRGTFVA